jgi:hemerythrin-like domain-containing protein
MAASQPIDVRDMAIVHRTFREAYDEAAQLVRGATTASDTRVGFLADHVDFCIAMLHIHHEGEDDLLYPPLIERAPEQAPVTEEIEHEHESIRAALDVATARCNAWRQSPSASTAADLATALDALSSELDRHLDDEEAKVIPLAAITLTQQEWDAIGEHAVAQIPRKQRGIAFGMILDPLDEDERAYMKRSLPAPVRVLSPLLIDRPWKKYASTLRSGT